MSVQDLGISLDTVWMLLAAMLVFFMQPGFALCEAGFTRSKNTANILFKNFVDFMVGSVLFWFVGFGFMFGSDGAGFIGMPNFGDLSFYHGDLPTEGFLMFETVFCATSATIVSGAMAERTKFSIYCIYSFFISLIIYPVEGHWPQGWGYMKMNPKYYPSPKALADSVHSMNAKLMISIWPNPQWCPEADDFKQRGMMLEHDIYDAFNPEARKLYWKYANDEFFANGFDAWWCDSSEPLDGDWNQIPKHSLHDESIPYSWDDHEYRWMLNKDVLSEALGVERSSLFSLYHSMGIYENQRATTANRYGGGPRVVNLTRSTYAGQQRYGTIVWNGDTHASWQSFRQQIPAGLNYMATGNPYWTVDVGSFFTKDDGRRWFYKGEFQNGVKDDAYKEYYVRMFPPDRG